MSFKDHFSGHSVSYAKYRPRYPHPLFDFVSGLCQQHRIAWDCATGSGQAAVELVRHFEHVVATDASAAQIQHATQHPHVEYRVAPAEESGLPDASMDMITVAQALHWFDLDKFFAEARRVAAPGAAIAVWSYGDPTLDDPALDSALQQFNGGKLASYWPAERHKVGDGYYGLPFPFEEVPAPSLTLEQEWTLEEFVGYLDTWSAVNAYRMAHGVDPVIQFKKELGEYWTGEHKTHLIRWPLAVRAGLID